MRPLIELVSQHAIPFQLVLFRLAGLFVFAPMLSGQSVPIQARVLVAVTLAAAVYPMAPAAAQIRPDVGLFELAPLVAQETLLGAAMGAVALVPLLGMQMGGQVMGHQMGLALARSFNPTLQIDSDTIGQLMFFLAMTIFIAVGGVEGLFTGVLGTFDRVPAGGFGPERAPLELYVRVLGAGTELALRVAAPATGALLLVMLSMGFVMKTMPQINILSVGFPFKVLVGLVVVLLSLWIIHEVGRAHVERVVEQIMAWADGLGAGAGAGGSGPGAGLGGIPGEGGPRGGQ